MPLLSQGPFLPTIVTDIPTPINNAAWANLANILVDDFADCTMDPGGPSTDHSDLIYATGYNFTIPANTVVVGVVANVIHRTILITPTIEDLVVQLLLAGVQTGDNKQSVTLWPRGIAAVSYGSTSDTWSIPLLPVNVNDPNFGLAFEVVNTDVVNANTAFLKGLTLTVYYMTTPTQAVAIIRAT